jgi:hypothetical protein
MLYDKRTKALKLAGERVRNPYGDGDLILSNWYRAAHPKKRGQRREYYIVVQAYKGSDHGRAVGYDTYEPYELGLEWKEGHESSAATG